MAGEGESLARLWLHGPGLVPGLRDMRLPGAEAALAHFRAQGYAVHLRSSGGRLVVLDQGVLNVAITCAGERLPGVEQGFGLMADVLGRALAALGLASEVGEVEGSICAGRYDLSVGGRKVAGLSQRRRRNFALIHAFLLVEGSGEERERIATAFYALAGATQGDSIRPRSMTSLAEHLAAITVAQAAEAIGEVLRAL